MPMFDFKCDQCGEIEEQYVLTRHVLPLCRKCTGTTTKVWVSKAPYVIPDSIDVHIENGLCHADGTPRHFESRGELRRAAKESGHYQVVRHVGTPGQGSDKSKHTSRWI